MSAGSVTFTFIEKVDVFDSPQEGVRVGIVKIRSTNAERTMAYLNNNAGEWGDGWLTGEHYIKFSADRQKINVN